MRSLPIALALTAVLLALPAAGALAQGADHVASEGVTLVQNVRTAGAGMGASLAGDRLFVTSPSHMTIFDVSAPEAPVLTAIVSLGAANESEAVATDGRLAAVAEGECLDPEVRGGCVAIFDVDEPTGVQRVASVDMQAQTVACVLGCRYLWVAGENAILDVADPANPVEIGSFLDGLEDPDLQGACYSARETRPGLVMVSCNPILALSTLPEHGGTPQRPALVATAHPPQYSPMLFGGAPHSSHWPQGGTDRFMLSTTETPFQRACTDDLGSFVTWDAAPVLGGATRFHRIEEWRPQNGTYLDGRSPYNAVGCSPHWLAEHPTFAGGGLVAVAALENGLRFLQVTPEGRIVEQGWFLGLGGTAAVPVWHPDGRTLYLADYARGLDVLRYEADLFVPPAVTKPAPAAGPSEPPAAARRFRVLGVVRSARGRATIAVEAPGAGRLTASPRARGLRLRTVRVQVRRAGLATVTIGATGRARRVLARRRRLAVDVRISWRPRHGRPQERRVRVVLRAGRARR